MNVVAIRHCLADGFDPEPGLRRRFEDQLFPCNDNFNGGRQFGCGPALDPDCAVAVGVDQIAVAYLHSKDIDVAANAFNADKGVAGGDAADDYRETVSQHIEITNGAVGNDPGAA